MKSFCLDLISVIKDAHNINKFRFLKVILINKVIHIIRFIGEFYLKFYRSILIEIVNKYVYRYVRNTNELKMFKK